MQTATSKAAMEMQRPIQTGALAGAAETRSSS